MAKIEDQGNQGGGNTGQGQSNQGENQGGSSQGQSMDEINSNKANVEGWRPGQVGEVQDEDQDGRLKKNRIEGKTLGTTEHSAEAPYAKKDGEFINGEGEGDQGGQGYGGSGNQGDGNR